MARITSIGSGAALLFTGLALAMSSLTVSAASKRPDDPDCQKWERRTMTGNWVNAPNGEYWVCVQGPKSGTKVMSSTCSARPDSDDGDDDNGNGNGKKDKPGWGYGDKNREHCGPPGQDKKKD